MYLYIAYTYIHIKTINEKEALSDEREKKGGYRRDWRDEKKRKMTFMKNMPT